MVGRRTWLPAIAFLLSFCAAGDLFAQSSPTDHLIRFYQQRAAGDPDDFFNFSKLGGAYIQKARETGDITYYELAEKALKRSLELVPNHPRAASATTNLAVVLFAKHQFGEALALAQKALDLGSGDLSPYAIAGDAYVELGEYDKASVAYSRMLSLPGPLYPHSRLSYLQFLRGNSPGAIQHMRRAVEAAIEGNAPKENIAWSQVQLGDALFHTGDLVKADQSYRDALTTLPGYHPALAALAKVRAARHRYPEAVAFYRKAIAIIPLPAYAAALGDVFARLGRADEAKKQYDLVEFIGHLNALNKVLYNRELAAFYADHDMKLKAAVELAKKELEVRRDIYTYDVLAWTLYKNGKPRDALGAMTEALRLGTQDARLFFDAGMIHHRLGEAEKAKAYLGRALSTNPHFHIVYSDVAERTLKELGGSPARAASREKGDRQ